MDRFERDLTEQAGKAADLDRAHNRVALKMENLSGKIDAVTRDIGEMKDMLASVLSGPSRRRRPCDSDN